MRCLRSVAAGLACALAVLVSSLSPATAQSLTWTGTVSNAWDIQTTTNWLNPSGVQDYYYDGGNVTFGDSAANTNIAITAGGVAPASVTFTNNTTPYTLSGGPINDSGAGPTAVTLNGSGSVTFSATNNYTGGTTINAGTLVSASQYALGTGPITLNGGALSVSGGLPGLLEGELGGPSGGHWADWTGTPTSWTPVLSPRNAYVFNGTAPYAPWYQQTTWVYSGYIYFPGNNNNNLVTFGWTIDDAAQLKIDGSLWSGTSNGGEGQDGWHADITGTLTPGWHQFEWRGSNNGGPGGQSGSINGISLGFFWDTSGGSTSGVALVDPGDGSLFTYGAPGTTLYSNTLNVTASSTLNVSGMAGFANLALGSALHVSGSNAVMTFNSTSVSGTGTLNVDAAMSVMLPAVGDNGTAATFVKTGAGPVVLTGTNTFTAGTAFQVNAGNLVAVGQSYVSPGPASGPLGSAPVILNNGTLVLAATSTAPISVDIVSGNAVTLAGSGGSIIAGMGSAASGAVANGTVTLAGSSAFPIAAGQTLNLGSSNGYTLGIDPGLQFSNSGTISGGPGSVTLSAGNLTSSVGTLSAASGGTLTMAGPISTGVYAPAATGTVVLSGAYSGSLANLAPAAGGTLVIANNISAGTLNVAGGAYAATSPASFGPTTLQLNGGTLAAATALTGGNAIANSLVFTTTGAKTLNFGGTFNLELSGSLNLSSGTYNLNDPAGMGTLSGVISGGGTLNITGNPTLTAANTYTGKTILNSNTDVTIGNNRAFGTGTITFSSSSSDGFQASTPLIGGNAVANPWAIAKNDTAWFNGANAIQLSGSSSLPSGTESIELTNPGLTVVLSGSISGAGSLLRSSGSAGQVNGTLIINNPANTFSGGFTLQSLGGYVDVQGASTTVSLGSVTKGPLGTGAITIGSSNTGYIGLLNSSPLAVTLANALTIDDGCYYMSSSGLTFSGHVTLGGTSPMINFLLGTNDNIAFTGTIIGGDGINLRQGYGGGGLKLSGTASSYSGATSITMGTLIAGGNAFSGANGVFGDATSAITIGDANSGGNPAALVTGGAYTIGRPITVNATAGPTTLGTIGGGTSTYSGAILVNSSSVALSAVPGSSVLFTGNISGSGGITASSPGNGNVGLMGTNSYTGATTVAGGQLTLDYSALAASAGTVGGIVPPASPVVLSGGTLAFAGNASAAVNETFVSTGVAGFGSTVVVSGSGTGVKVNLGPLSRSGGVLDLAASAGVFSTSSSNTSGILGGYLTVNGYTDWASVSSSGTIGGLSANGGYNTNDFSNPGNNVDVTGAVSPPAGAVTVNSLRFNSGSVNLGLNGPLTLASGGILVTPSGGSSGISGGALTSSSGTTAANSLADVVVIQGNTAAPFTISSPITDNGSTPVGLTKGGPGALLLTGSNTFSGPISVSGGTLQMGTGQPGQDSQLAGNVNNNGAFVVNLAGNQTYGGTISGGGSFTKGGTGTLALTGTQSYSGATTLSAGVLQLKGALLPAAGSVLWLNADDTSTMTFGAGNVITAWASETGGPAGTVTGNGNGGAGGTYTPGIINGQAVVHFTNSQYMFNNVNYSSPVTMFAVEEMSDANNHNRIVSGHNNNFLFGFWNGLQDQAYFNGWVSNNGTGPTADTSPHMYVATIAGAGQNSTFYAYNSSAGTVQQLFSNQGGTDGPDGLQLNGYQGGNELSDANVAEVLIYPGVLSNAQVAQTEAYLETKYFGSGNTAGSNLLPITTPLTIAAGATLDLYGASQQLASLSDSGGSGGAVINGNASGYGNASTLTLSPNGGSSTFSGTIGGAAQGPISLAMSGNGTQLLAGSLQGTGSLSVTSGLLELGGVNPMVGITTLSGGTLQVNNSLALEGQTLTLSATAGVLSTTGLASLTLGGLAGAGNLAAPAGPLTIGGNGMTTTYAGNLSGATSLTKVGSGSLYLSGSNSVGNTLVSAGAIEAELAASLSGSVSVAGGAGFILPTGNGATGWTGSQIGVLLVSSSWANNSSLLTIDTTNASVTIANSINQPLSLTKVGPGALTLAASNTYSGPTTVTGGALNLAHNLAVQNSTVTVSSSGALTFAAGITSPTLGGLAGSASLALATAAAEPVTLNVGQNGQNTTYTGVLSGAGGLNKVGAGTLTLTTSSSYGGATTISGGVLQLHGVPTAPPVPGYSIWFDESKLGLADGASVSLLTNGGTLGGTATVPGGASHTAPTYIANAGTGTGLGALNFTGNNGGSSEALQFTQDSNIRTVFSIFKGASFLLTDIAGGSYNFHRYNADDTDATAPLWDNLHNPGTGWASPYITGGTTSVDGVVADYSSTNMPVLSSQNGYNLVALETTGPVQADSFNADRNTIHSGNQSQAELIIYDYPLSSSQMQQVENYLDAKWFGIGGGGNNLLPITTPLTIAANGTLDLGGASQQVASLSDSAPGSGGSIINSSTGSAAVLTLTPTGGSTTFSGMIQGGGTLGSTGLVLDGPGTMVLSGTNTYTGGTTVWNGTLQLNNNEALADGSSLSVGSGLAAFGLVEPSAVAAPAAASPAAAVAAVPEPGTLALLGVAGIVAAAAACRRRRMKS